MTIRFPPVRTGPARVWVGMRKRIGAPATIRRHVSVFSLRYGLISNGRNPGMLSNEEAYTAMVSAYGR